MAVTIEEHIDNVRLQPRTVAKLVGISAISCIAVIFDGFDYQVLAVAAPKIAAEWQIDPVLLGALPSITFVGMLIGAISMGALGDSWGRRKTLLTGILIFAVFMGTASFAQNYGQLAVLRFLAGVGMGSVLPTAILILSEFCPRRRRAQMIGLGAGSFTFGLVVAPVVAGQIVPDHGWRPLFALTYLAAIVALLVFLFVPESPQFLLSKGKTNEARAVLRRLYPGIDQQIDDGQVALVTPPPEGAATGRTSDKKGIAAIWAAEHRTVTLLLSLIYILIQVVLTAINFWTVQLLVREGLTLPESYSYATIAPLAGIAGMLIMGWILDRTNPYLSLGIAFALGGLSLILFGLVGPSTTGYVVFAGAGALLQGVMTTVHLLVVNAYRTELKATGLGWANGIGRAGAIVAPLGAGYLVAQNLSFGTLFTTFGLPALLCSVVIAVLFAVQSRARGADTEVSVTAAPPEGTIGLDTSQHPDPPNQTTQIKE